MKQNQSVSAQQYKVSMARLLVMYTQVNHLIMRAVAERVAIEPDDESQLFMAKQVGDENKHVRIQQAWIKKFGTIFIK